MINLAGDVNCDTQIEIELRTSGIDIVRHERKCTGEVPSSITGELHFGEFLFIRAWTYWVVKGKVHISVAQAMYADESRRDVRVAGHCAAPPPDEWATPTEEEIKGMCLVNDYNYEHYKRFEKRFVESYHIDSQEGLNFFVQHVTGKVKETNK